MTVFKHELRQGKIALIAWTVAISFMLGVCIIIYPEMSAQMKDISDLFANMGSFSNAFGMDQLNFGEFIDYFSIECGNVLGIGGALFASLLGINALSKEEKDRTCEFLFVHPVSRTKIIAEKLLAIITQIVIFNLVVAIFSGVFILIIKESFSAKIFLLFLANTLTQICIGAITFSISAFIKHNGLGIGLGIAIVFYFLNIISNLMDSTKFLKFITPFGWTDGSYIVTNCALHGGYLTAGIVIASLATLVAFWQYNKKDIS